MVASLAARNLNDRACTFADGVPCAGLARYLGPQVNLLADTAGKVVNSL